VPTFFRTPLAIRQFRRLTPEQRVKFGEALQAFLEDLPARQFRPSLRVKRVQGTERDYEMTWEYHDGRAVFTFGDTAKGEADVIWLRIGGHEIFEKQ
jgi:hypothetical protein